MIDIFEKDKDEFLYRHQCTLDMTNDERIDFLNQEAIECFEQSEYELAYDNYRELIAIDELPMPNIWYNLAICAKVLGKTEEYKEALRRSGRTDVIEG